VYIDDMKKNSIVITGGAGFIGSEFVRQAVERQQYSKIFVLDKLTYASDLNRIKKELETNNVELIEADVTDSHKYSKVLKECFRIVHFAAESHVDKSISNGNPFIHSNIVGTFTILESARLNSVNRVLLVSTDEVYGSIESGEFLEKDILNPSSTYSASKSASDLLALAQHKTFKQDIIVARCVNNYGAWQHKEKFIPNAVDRALKGEQILLYGNGLNVREWIHVSDHVCALNLILEHGNSGEIFNIGSGERLTNFDIALEILRILGKNSDQIKFIDDRPGHDFRYAVNSKKVRNTFNWSPKVNFKQGLKELINFSKVNQDLQEIQN
jgi:dTDP-glucose 4,6-dehydratase